MPRRPHPSKGASSTPAKRPQRRRVPVRPAEETIPVLKQLPPVELHLALPGGRSPESDRARQLHIMALMIQGAPLYQIQEYAHRTFGLEYHATQLVMRAIRNTWRDEYNEAVPFARAEVIMRLRSDLTKMRSANVLPDGSTDPRAKLDWAAIRQHERLLAQIEGTLQPIRVQVLEKGEALRGALHTIIGNMDPKDMEAFLAEGQATSPFQPVAAE